MKVISFAKFSGQFEKSFKDNPLVIRSVLANIFSMRIIRNKTHGDLAEIALTEYINQFVDGFSARHTGKEKFRAKEHEEDIKVKDLQNGEEIPMVFKVIVFDLLRAYASVRHIKFLPPRKFGVDRQTFPIYKFYDAKGEYIFEVRYGDAKANALQRGMWTHTENAHKYFRELLSGEYRINEPLINLISKILVSPKEKHEEILKLFPKSKEKSVI